MAVRVAATPRIADLIAAGPRTAPDLAEAANANADVLRRCAEAAGADGKVFVVERVGANADSRSTARDLRSLAYFAGRERSLAELTALAADSGLKLAAVHSAGVNSIVELTARP